MRIATGAATMTAIGAASAALVLVLAGDSPTSAPSAARADCSTRSEASFPGAFTDPRNLVAGPLVLVGGRTYTPAAAVREFGGNKFPLLVQAGHTVVVRLPRQGGVVAGLAYSHGRGTRARDGDRSVTFVACRPRTPSRRRPGGPSGSFADGVAVTFWSGFVLTRAPACVALDVFVDGEPSPRRVGLSLGRRCRT